ncbi:MAG: alpha/beta hydrolase [Acidimicrobiales bacterium]
MSERTITTNGVSLNVVVEGDGPAVVLAHGFPELSYSWRHQIPALARAGYTVIAPDQRGYGESSRPEAIEDYDIHHLTDDLLGVLDALGHQKAVFVGHDWGSIVVWQQSLLHPERVAGVVGMSVPFLRRGQVSTTVALKAIFGDQFFYILYFQEPGVADADLGRDPARTMRGMLAGLTALTEGNGPAAASLRSDAGFVERLAQPETLPEWLSQAELDHYVAAFSRTGFTGALNWYRNFDRNWETTSHLDGAKVEVPSLFIGGTLDPVLVMSPPSVMDGWLDDHRGTVLIDGAGHWVQQEKPDDVNAALLEFLGGLSHDGRSWA